MTINRLKENLITTSKIGRKSEKTILNYGDLDQNFGVNRLEGTIANKLIRNYAVACMREAGLEVVVDKVGNIFGRRNGSKTNKGSILCGSHLDSVKNGGMFDGVLGVFSAIEVMRRMKDDKFNNERPIDIVVYTGEEGSAFGRNLIGSSVLVGDLEYKEALNELTFEGKTLGEALHDIGYQGSIIKKIDHVEFSVELHIEQGPVLDNEKIPIGIVENICGISWIDINIEGIENHAGTTPMEMRKDALVAASELVIFIKNLALKMKSSNKSSSIVATVGKLNIYPNGINIIPGKVEMGIDVRDIKKDNIESFKNKVFKFAKELEKKYRVRCIVNVLFTHPPISLSVEVRRIIENVTNDLEIKSKKMNSGASHDSQSIAKAVKTGMIFLPSKGGISHSPLEWTEWEDIDIGVKVLEETLKRLSLIDNLM